MTPRGLAGTLTIILAGMALLLVAMGAMLPVRPPPPDEGALARLFQLTVALELPAFLLVVATANWRQPLHAARPLVIATLLLAMAFALLNALEGARENRTGWGRHPAGGSVLRQ